MRRHPLATSLVLLAVITGTHGQITGQADLQAKVQNLLRQAEASPLADVWSISRKLSDLKGTEDALAKAMVDAVHNTGSNARLATARALADLAIVVPLARTSDRIQELHIKVLHIVIEAVERHLFPQNYGHGGGDSQHAG